MKRRENSAEAVGRAGHDPATYGLKGRGEPANTTEIPAKRTRRGPTVDHRGQVGMGVGEQIVKVEPEASVLQRVQMALSLVGGVWVFRNTVGFVKKGSRGITYGLARGSSDLVAIVAPYGRWLCIETKRGKGGVVEPEQKAWLERMRSYGAVVGVCRTPEEALLLVAEARKPVEAW